MPPDKKKENTTRLPVTVISTKGETALIQYLQDGQVTRKYIPVKELGDGHVLETVLARGIPYGYPWEDLEMKFDSVKLAHELHQRDIWTPNDALTFPQKLLSALNAVYADNISQILNIALKEKRSIK